MTRGAPPASEVASRAATLRRLELEVTRRLDGLVSGDHLADASGPGTEPAGARLYGPGDDARRIDWSLTARSLAPHVRTTEADRELETWLVVDRSASMDFGTARVEKRDIALAAAAAFGFVGARSGNRIGVVVAGGDRLTRVPARSGRTRFLGALATCYDAPRAAGPPGGEADLAAALRHVDILHRRRGHVVVISDFLDGPAQHGADETWIRPLQALALRHQVIAVHVTDRRELTLPAVGLLGVVDAETGRRLHVQTNTPRLRARFEAAARARRDGIERRVLAARCEYCNLDTGRDWLVDVARFLTARRATRRHVRLGGMR